MYESIKTLALASLANNNISLTRNLLDILQEYKQHSQTSFDKDIILSLQLSSDPSVDRSYNVRYDPLDSYDIIYEKTHVNLFLSLMPFLSESRQIAIELLSQYNGNRLRLKQQILLTFIKGRNCVDQFEYFVEIADFLLSTGLDVNYLITNYDGQTVTPHSYAILLRYNKIAEYLVEHGAKTDHKPSWVRAQPSD